MRANQWLGSLSLAALLSASFGASAQTHFVQDRFAIGFWVDPPADAKMDARYAEIADANFTLVLGSFGASNLDLVKRQLELCEKYDLKALVWSGTTPADQLPESSALWGYMLRDEPHTKDFPALRKRADEIRAARPGRLAYINLFPDYANAEKTLGAKGLSRIPSPLPRRSRLRRPQHGPLPLLPARTKTAATSIAATSKPCVSKRSNAASPSGTSSTPCPSAATPTPAKRNCAGRSTRPSPTGAKGVLYFCYYTPVSDEFPKGGAIIRVDGRRTRHYDQAKRINAAIKNLGPTIMKLTSTGGPPHRPHRRPLRKRSPARA